MAAAAFRSERARLISGISLSLLAITASIIAVREPHLRAWLLDLGLWGQFAISMANGAAPIPGPSQVAVFVAGASMNPLALGLASGTGGAIGELAGYFVGAHGERLLSERRRTELERLDDTWLAKRLHAHTALVLFSLAAVPNFLFDFYSVWAGARGIPLGRYFVPVWAGKVVRHVLIASIGGALGR